MDCVSDFVSCASYVGANVLSPFPTECRTPGRNSNEEIQFARGLGDLRSRLCERLSPRVKVDCLDDRRAKRAARCRRGLSRRPRRSLSARIEWPHAHRHQPDDRAKRGRMDTTLKRRHRIPNGTMAPFSYRIPIAFIDSASLRDLWVQTRRADSIAYTVPMTDIRYRQREAAPFIERYPGAWGRLTLSRVAFGPRLRDAAVEVRYASVMPGANYGDEIFRLVRNRNEWKVVKRVPRNEAIKPEPLPYGMLHAWVDSSLLPAPRRRFVRGTVRDSASGRPLSGIVIRVKAAPLGSQGQILRDKVPEEWGTLLTDAAGKYAIFNPPSGYASIEAECPPTRGLRGGGLAPAALEPGSGLDTVLDFRVRFAACPALARFMAAEAKRHLEDVKRAKVEAAARAVQGNLWGTLRDSRTGRPVPRALDTSG